MASCKAVAIVTDSHVTVPPCLYPFLPQRDAACYISCKSVASRCILAAEALFCCSTAISRPRISPSTSFTRAAKRAASASALAAASAARDAFDLSVWGRSNSCQGTDATAMGP
jgi:hypothetical protein